MSFYQCVACDTEELTTRYDKTNCKAVTRPYGMDKIIGFHCSLNFDDFLDTAAAGEWETALTDGKILLSPFFGKFITNEGTSENLEDGCGRKIPDTTTIPWEFTTPSATSDYSDEDWWRAFHREFHLYSWGFFNCAGRLYLNDEAVTAIKTAQAVTPTIPAVPLSDPGFAFSLNTIPQFVQINGAGKTGQWRCTGEFLANDVLRSVNVPGLAALLADNG